MGWGGVGWGMLTFVWTCWGSWCYADDGVGWGGVGHVNVRVNLLRFLTLRWWWGGVGWGMLTFVWTCWACLNLFEAEIAFRLGEIHIYLENHQIQTSEFQSFCDRWIVFSPRRNDDFLKKTVFHDLTFRSAGMFMHRCTIQFSVATKTTDSPGGRHWMPRPPRYLRRRATRVAHGAEVRLARRGDSTAKQGLAPTSNPAETVLPRKSLRWACQLWPASLRCRRLDGGPVWVQVNPVPTN